MNIFREFAGKYSKRYGLIYLLDNVSRRSDKLGLQKRILPDTTGKIEKKYDFETSLNFSKLQKMLL